LLVVLLFRTLPARRANSPGPLSKPIKVWTEPPNAAAATNSVPALLLSSALDCHKEYETAYNQSTAITLSFRFGSHCKTHPLPPVNTSDASTLIHWEPSQKQFDHR